jgi:hypothetical protein
MKPIQVIGRDLSKLTDAEIEGIITQQARWPLKQLRKHQSVVEHQIELAVKAKKEPLAINNLQVRLRLLTEAVIRKEFKCK